MNESVSKAPTSTNLQAQPGRLVAYFALLFFFIFQTSLVLRELGANYDLQQFAKIKSIIDEAFTFSMGFDDLVYTFFALLLSFIFTLPIAWVYTLTKDEDNFDPSLAQTIVVLAMVVTGVMVVISDELARAFSLAGVVAAVRFRNTLQDTKDAVYIFIAVAIGMGCGTRVYHITVWLSVIMSLTMYFLWKYKFGTTLRAAKPLGKKEVQKIYTQASGEALQQIERGLEQQVRLLQWVQMRTDDEKGKKKPNAALIIESSDAYTAIEQVDKVLDAYGGKWQLANITSETPGRSTLEYVGRLPKETTPAVLIGAIQANSSAAVIEVTFRSLKGLKSPVALDKKSNNNPDEGD
ncbi:MAG: hypothetical protein ALAOOOJD_00195 [bacterium]|nr:hypothetical protein [bacterium]